ncbi:MAG: VOC family protein [Paracoccaceae bacterium]
MKRLAGVRLHVPDPATLARFYVDVMGMTAKLDDEAWRCGYNGQDADLILLPGGGGYSHERNHRYWKIGITVPNVDMAVDDLHQSRVAVSDPRQFGDIGYMAHLADPNGFVIELLQHDFENNRPSNAGDHTQPLGGSARVGQITLRTSDISTELAQHSDMQLLSVQPVTEYGFDLYFLAYSQERPTNPDLRTVENREWLWKRPYTTLEFQHLAGAEITINSSFGGLEILE